MTLMTLTRPRHVRDVSRRSLGVLKSTSSKNGKIGLVLVTIPRIKKKESPGDGGMEDPILLCRRRSSSMWLHFPHLELLFLFWAFEGAVGVQVSTMRSSVFSWAFWLAFAAMVAFPALLISMVSRAIIVRVQPDDLIRFRVYGGTRQENEDSESLEVDAREAANVTQTGDAIVSMADMRMKFECQESEGRVGTQVGRLETVQWKDCGDNVEEEQTRSTAMGCAADGVPRQGFWSKFAQGWRDRGLLFGWADTGHWESVATHDGETRREADWFRIGFEPIFVDFNKDGCTYLIFLLLKWFAVACIGALVDDDVPQLLLFAVIHAIDAWVLIRFSPFANRAVNMISILLAIVDCVSSAFIGAAAALDGTNVSDALNDVVFFVDLAALVGILVPVYIDSGMPICILVVDKMNHLFNAATVEDSRPRESPLGDEAGTTPTRIYIRRIALKRWPAFWCFMMYRNILACGRDIRDGVRSRSRSSLLLRRNSRDHHRAGQAQGEHSCAPAMCCSRPPEILESPLPVVARLSPGNAPPEPSRSANISGASTMAKPHVARWILPPRLQSIGHGATTWDVITGRSTAFDPPQEEVRREGNPKGRKLSAGSGGDHIDSGV